MAEEDFDINSLAAYLHLDPQQVARLACRDRLPGRRISGEWRFSRAEIHHWLERRIGLSDEDELVAVEDVLDRSAPADEARDVSLKELLPREAIAIPLGARTRSSVIRSMVDLAAQTGWLWDPVKMVQAVRSREEMHPTALENGVALLHPRRPMASILGKAVVALGRTAAGIPFGGDRGVLTDVFFLICSVDDRSHLQTLARLSRMITTPGFLEQIREAPDRDEVHRLIVEAESRLT